MPLTIEQLREEIFALPQSQRDELLGSVQQQFETTLQDMPASWSSELDRRMSLYHGGKSQAIPWEEAEHELDELVNRP